jgi:hypothetical protein
MRRRLASSILSALVNCFYCLSVWVSALFVFILNHTWKGRLLLWPALSAGAIIIGRTLHLEILASEPIYREDQEAPPVLRQEQGRESIRNF